MLNTKSSFEKRAEIQATSGHLQLHALITWNTGQDVAGNSELCPVWRHSFRNVAPSKHLAVNSFIVRRHMTVNQPMNGRDAAGKTPTLQQLRLWLVLALSP